MAQLRQDYQKFIERDTEIIAIGPERPQLFADWWKHEKMPFIGIADPEHIIANRYGQKVNALRFGRMPAMVIVDKEGTVVYRHYGKSMSDIPSDVEILSFLDDLNKKKFTNEIA